ncbi:hypothetical protein [Pseudomonas syringae]|uniref:hypothetical protein n=1 Tax=Pseudomonas syringae TaxID=317 RepID=UPI0026BEBF48
MFSHQSIKVSPCSHATFDYLLDQVLLELAVLAVEVIAFIARQDTGRVGDVRTDILTRRREAILLVNMLLKSFKVLFMILVHINRIGLIAAQQVDARDNDVNVWLAVNDLAGFPVSDRFHFGQMRFGIQIELFWLIRMHEKVLEVGRDRFKQLRRNGVFFETECKSKITVLTVIWDTFVDGPGQTELTLNDQAMVQLITGELST